jgi:hypothetical protein
MDPSHPVPWFPAWGVKFAEPVENVFSIVSIINEWRPSNRWLMTSYEAIASEAHLWTTWYSLRRNEESGEMIAKTPDAEFLRIIAGTHQINKAFERAGLTVGDENGWIISLPDWQIGDGFGDFEIPRSSYNDRNADANRLIEHIEATLIPRRPFPTKSGLDRIGAEYPIDLKPEMMEGAFLSHAALSDLR